MKPLLKTGICYNSAPRACVTRVRHHELLPWICLAVLKKRKNKSRVKCVCLSSITRTRFYFFFCWKNIYWTIGQLVKIKKYHNLYYIFTMRMIMLTLFLGCCPFSQTTSNGFVKALIPTWYHTCYILFNYFRCHLTLQLDFSQISIGA